MPEDWTHPRKISSVGVKDLKQIKNISTEITAFTLKSRSINTISPRTRTDSY